MTSRPRRSRLASFAVLGATCIVSGCSHRAPEADAHAGHETSPSSVGARTADNAAIPASATTVADRLAKSPRHGEYVTIPTGPWTASGVGRLSRAVEQGAGSGRRARDLRAVGLGPRRRRPARCRWVHRDRARPPDREGRPAPGSDTVAAQAATAAIRSLRPDDVQRQIAAVGQYGMSLPAAEKRYGVVGFCWGGRRFVRVRRRSPAGRGRGGRVLRHLAQPRPRLRASRSRCSASMVETTHASEPRFHPADSAMKALGKRFEHRSFAGAGHGFLRQQEGQNGANLTAARQAWPMTIAFFRSTLGR